jgi:hypothetical protein
MKMAYMMNKRTVNFEDCIITPIGNMYLLHPKKNCNYSTELARKESFLPGKTVHLPVIYVRKRDTIHV